MIRRAGLVAAAVGIALAGGVRAQTVEAPPPAAPAAAAATIAATAQVAPAATPEEPATPPAEPAATAEASGETPAGSTAAAGAPAAVPAGPPLDRISFEFKVSGDKGGGAVAGTAGSVESTGEGEITLAGGIEIKYRNMTFRADRAVLQRDAMTLEAEGDVVLDQGTRRIAATRADFDLATENGTFWNASAFAEPDQYFTGAVLTKTGDNTFEIQDGVVTSCTGDPTPDWSVRVAHASIEVGGYAHMTHGRIRIKKLPVFYWPYLIWPVKTDRSSGLLIPNFGYSARRGAYLGLAYYQTLGRSADATFHLDGYETTYEGGGVEVRYAPTEGTRGNALFYVLKNRDVGQSEWRGIWNHTTDDLPGGLKAVVTYNNYSDYDFFREFQRTENENTRSFLYSNAFLSGNWGAQSFSTLLDERKSFLGSGDTATTRQLPRVSYQVRKVKLGSMPLYFSVDTLGNVIKSSSTVGAGSSYSRLDVDPTLTLPLRVAPWLSVSLAAGERATWWARSLPRVQVDPLTGNPQRVCGDTVIPDDQVYCDSSLTRTYPSASAEVVGPSFSKIFDSPGGHFSKFKHVIEPRWDFSYVGQFDDQDIVPRFDNVDSLRTTEVASFALVNRVLAKPTDEEEGGAFEIFSFQLSQSYSFDDTQPFQVSSDGSRSSQRSPIVAQLRYSPSKVFDLQAKANWSTLFSGLNSTSLSFSVNAQRVNLDATWYTNYNPEFGDKKSDQARFGFKFDVVPERLQLSGQLNYDILNSEVLQQTYAIGYNSQCWGIVLQGREQITSTLKTRDYRFLLNLKNVGTFLDLGTGQSTARF